MGISRTLPKVEARRTARICALKMSFSRRQNRIARSPIAGFISSASSSWEANLSPPGRRSGW